MATITLKANTLNEMLQICKDFLRDSSNKSANFENAESASIQNIEKESTQTKFVLSENSVQAPLQDLAGLKDIIASPEQINEFNNIVDLLKNSKKYLKRQITIPKGVLFYGQDTDTIIAIANAIATDANAVKIIFSMASLSHNAQVAVQLITTVFEKALENSKKQPVVIILEDFEQLACQTIFTTQFNAQAVNNSNLVLNYLLDQMDSFENDENCPIMLFAISNVRSVLRINPEVLDYGYFQQKVYIEPLTLKYRAEVLKSAFLGEKIAKDISIQKIAERTAGYSVSDIFELVNNMKIISVRNNSKQITNNHVNEAISYFNFGQRSEKITNKELEKTAVHESGHALVAFLLGENVSEISILPHLGVGGYISYSESKFEEGPLDFNDILNMVKICVASKVAEEKMYQTSGTGISADLESATNLITSAIAIYGMSDKIGPINLVMDHYMAEASKEDVYHEAKRLLNEVYLEVKKMLDKYDTQFNKLWKELLKKEYLTTTAIEKIIGQQYKGIEKLSNN